MPQSGSDSPKVFIVHALEDQAIAIEAETALRRADLQVRASWQILSWETLVDLWVNEELKREFIDSDVVLLIASSISVTSESFTLQIEFLAEFLAELWRRDDKRRRVMPVFVE